MCTYIIETVLPKTYLIWIHNQLKLKRTYIGQCFSWFNLLRGGSQGSIFTPLLFITYHCDLSKSLVWCSSHIFADDLAIIKAERTHYNILKQKQNDRFFFENLDYYCVSIAQGTIDDKKEALCSIHVISYPNIELTCGTNKIVTQIIKYLEYSFTSKFGIQP